MEEERRLFFVGMTRARDELVLTTSPEASPFLDELPKSVTRTTAKGRPRPGPAAKSILKSIRTIRRKRMVRTLFLESFSKNRFQ